MSSPVWKTELLVPTDAGTIAGVGPVTAFEPVASFAINRAPTLTFRVRNDDDLVTSIVDWRSRVKAWRSPTKGARADLKLYNVVGSCTDTFGDGGGVAVPTFGPLHYLTRRNRQNESVYGRAAAEQRVFNVTDQHAIAKALVDDENVRYTTQIRTGVVAMPAGPARTVVVPMHKPVGQQLLEIASLFGGFEFDVLPLDDVDGYMGDFRVHYPAQGIDNLAVFLEHGFGKKNVVGGTREMGDRVTTDLALLGRNDGAAQLATTRTDTTRRDTYRALLDSVETFSDISDATMLGLLADEIFAARAAPRELYTITPAPTFEFRPFDDFNLGDRITARIREGRVNIDGVVRVWGFDVTILSTGEERLSSLTIVPEG